MANHELPSIDEMRAGLVPKTKEALSGLIERHRLPPDGEVVAGMVTEAYVLQEGAGYALRHIGKVRAMYEPLNAGEEHAVQPEIGFIENIEPEIIEED